MQLLLQFKLSKLNQTGWSVNNHVSHFYSNSCYLLIYFFITIWVFAASRDSVAPPYSVTISCIILPKLFLIACMNFFVIFQWWVMRCDNVHKQNIIHNLWVKMAVTEWVALLIFIYLFAAACSRCLLLRRKLHRQELYDSGGCFSGIWCPRRDILNPAQRGVMYTNKKKKKTYLFWSHTLPLRPTSSIYFLSRTILLRVLSQHE